VYQKTTFLGYLLYLAAARKGVHAAPNSSPASQQSAPVWKWNRRQSHEGSRNQWPPCRDPRKPHATLFLACQILTCLSESVQQPSSRGACEQASRSSHRASTDWMLRVASGLAWSVLAWFGQQRLLFLTSGRPKRAQDHGRGYPAAWGGGSCTGFPVSGAVVGWEAAKLTAPSTRRATAAALD
jgi:hypothetical protein